MKGRRVSSPLFFYSVLLIGLGYLIFQYFFIPYCIIAADEFVFARHIYDYVLHIPYRDFPPYKTVLGYYLLSFPLFFSHTSLAPIFYIKYEIALLNTLGMVTLFIASRNWFSRSAILFSALALIANHLFLFNSANLRVDLLAAWVGIIAFFCLLSHRPRLSGLLLGLAFLISQKIIWYFLAINFALLICWLAFVNAFFSWRTLLKFNVNALIPLVLYLLFWCLVPSIDFTQQHFVALCKNIFSEAYSQATLDLYLGIFFQCWAAVLHNGPALFLLIPLAGFLFFNEAQQQEAMQRTVFIFLFCTCVLFLFINYKQPFPYNFVLLAPVFFVFYANFITCLQQSKIIKITFTPNKNFLLFLSLTIYIYFIVAIIFFINLNFIYYAIALIPLAFLSYAYFSMQQAYLKAKFFLWGSYILLIFFMIGFPFYESWRMIKNYNGRYQHAMLQIAGILLENEDSYLAGVPFFYKLDQTVSGLQNLIAPAICYLQSPSPELKPLLLPSLFLSQSNTEDILLDLSRQSVKLIMNNYRIQELPGKIQNYLQENYNHFVGSIYIYAPTIKTITNNFKLKFDGFYQLINLAKPFTNTVMIDGKKYKENEVLFLKAGHHHFFAQKNFRLKLVPQIKNKQLEKYLTKKPLQKDDWQKMLKNVLA